MKKLWQKLLCVVLAIVVCVPIVACTDDPDSGKVTIQIDFNRGGVYSTWTRAYFDEYEKAAANKVFGSKTGVTIKYNDVTVHSYAQMKSSNNNIIMDGSTTSLYQYINDGTYMDITDVVTSPNAYNADGSSIASYLLTNADQAGIQDSYYVQKTGTSQKAYYGLPWKEFYAGITYDASLFYDEGLYFANAGDGIAYTDFTVFGSKTYWFTESQPDDSTKAPGPDGIAGTVDDGMPTSLEELMALCAYVKSKSTAFTPFLSTGGLHEDYTNYILTPIVAGIEGDNFETYFTFDGNVEVVDGYETEDLWGMSDVKVPKTKTVTISPTDKTTWHYLSETVARYYAIAFMKFAISPNQLWLEVGTSSADNISTQKKFVNSGTSGATDQTKRYAMIAEGTYWYTEAQANGTFASFDYYVGKENRKDFAVMPYVLALEGQNVSAPTGSKPILTGCEYGANVWINNNLNDDPVKNADLIAACKDFVQWFFSKDQLIEYTKTTGQRMGGYVYDWESLVYQKDGSGNYYDGVDGRERKILDDCIFSSYLISCMELRRDSNFVLQSPNEVNTQCSFVFSLNSTLWKTSAGCVYTMLKSGTSVQNFFNATFITIN